MAMGCSSEPKTFETFSTAVEWIAQTKFHLAYIMHLVDDFQIIAPTHHLCHTQLQLFLDLCHYLGIPIARDKTHLPAQVMSFAGIELDTVRFEARLPEDKIKKCIDLLSAFYSQKKSR